MKVLKSWFFEVTRTATKKGTRFLRLDRPTEDTYRTLIDSVPFFLETEDRAKDNQQGLVHAATNAEAKSYDASEIAQKTKAVQPHQLPEVANVSESFIINGQSFDGASINVSIDASETRRNRFLISISNAFISFLNSIITGLQSLIDSLQTIVASLQTDVANLQSDVSNLQTDVSNLQTDVADLQIDVNNAQLVADNALSIAMTNRRVISLTWLGGFSTSNISINYSPNPSTQYGLIGFAYTGTSNSITINVSGFWYPAVEYTLLVWNNSGQNITINITASGRGVIRMFNASDTIGNGKNVIFTIQDWNPNIFVARVIQP